VGLAPYFRWLPPAEIFTFDWIMAHRLDTAVAIVGALILILSFHFWMRGAVAKRIAAPLAEVYGQVDLNLRNAFLKSVGLFQSVFNTEPAKRPPPRRRQHKTAPPQAALTPSAGRRTG
ncbi:MAG: heme A synthase, partial [Paracoccaceae bacterium]